MSKLRLYMLPFLLAIVGDVGAQGQFEHTPQQRLIARRSDVTLWSYHFAKNVGVPYFHPVATPDGNVLTSFAPADHVWHRGLWFSWKYLNGVNYWEYKDRKTPTWEGQTRTVGVEVVGEDGENKSISTKLHYSYKGRLVLRENRKIVVQPPRFDGSYAMDWVLTFTAAEREVVFQRAPPSDAPWGGYGGLSYRASSELAHHRVVNSEGQLGKEGHGRPARWMDFRGTLAGGQVVGVAMFDHPDNPRYPTPWYVSTGKMGYLNPALLFNEPYSLPFGELLTLRYRVWVHPREVQQHELENEHQLFVGGN